MTDQDLERLEKLYKEADILSYHSALPGLISEIKTLRKRLEVAEKALSYCASLCGNPDPNEACRNVIKVAHEALEKIKEGKE